jgi:hypothetical protein
MIRGATRFRKLCPHPSKGDKNGMKIRRIRTEENGIMKR